MAQKHQTQAVSLTHRMAPYVQTVHPGDEKVSVESSIGKLMGAVFSKGDGKVISVTPYEMTVRYMDGTKETISLYNNHPLNRKTLISNEARVKPGDFVICDQFVDWTDGRKSTFFEGPVVHHPSAADALL